MKRAPDPAGLSAGFLLEAYSVGIFPMVDGDGDLQWHRPDPRAVFEMDRIPRPDRGTRRLLQQAVVTVDTAFEQVMRCCAEREETWIDDRLIEVYAELHRHGHAHSLEVRRNEQLIGGIYGVALGAAFFGESMFGVNNAGKAAFHALAERLRDGGFRLFDTQYINDFTRALGAVEVSRADFDGRLKEALEHEARFL